MDEQKPKPENLWSRMEPWLERAKLVGSASYYAFSALGLLVMAIVYSIPYVLPHVGIGLALIFLASGLFVGLFAPIILHFRWVTHGHLHHNLIALAGSTAVAVIMVSLAAKSWDLFAEKGRREDLGVTVGAVAASLLWFGLMLRIGWDLELQRRDRLLFQIKTFGVVAKTALALHAFVNDGEAGEEKRRETRKLLDEAVEELLRLNTDFEEHLAKMVGRKPCSHAENKAKTN